MTQFVLAAAKNHSANIVPISELRDDFFLEVSKKLFPDSPFEEIFILEIEGENIDDLMLEAQKSIAQSSKFKETKLYYTISKIAPAINELAFWYGSDYEDLDCIYDIPALLRKLEEAVNESTCELYVHYKSNDSIATI